MQTPERPPLPPEHEVQLWVPAGTEQAVEAAVAGGADGVLLGHHGTHPAPIASATATRQGHLARAIDHAHVRGVRVLLSLDPVIEHHPSSRADAFLEAACRLGADGALIEDGKRLAQVSRLPAALPVQRLSELTAPILQISRPEDLDELPTHIEEGIHVVQLATRPLDPALLAVLTRAVRERIDAAFEPEAERDTDLSRLAERILAGPGGQGEAHARIGEVVDSAAGWVQVRLEGTLRVHDRVRIENDPANWKNARAGQPEGAPDEATSYHLVADQILLDDDYTSQGRTGEVVQLGGHQWSAPGDVVYKTTDARVLEKAEAASEAMARRTVPITLHAGIEVGHRLLVTAVDVYRQLEVTHTSEHVIEEARSAPMTEANAIDQLDRLGDTPFRAVDITVDLHPNAFVPVSELNAARRRAVEQLERVLAEAYHRGSTEGGTA